MREKNFFCSILPSQFERRLETASVDHYVLVIVFCCNCIPFFVVAVVVVFSAFTCLLPDMH